MRPSLDQYMMNLIEIVKTRGTCPRRQVGAIVTDNKGHILGTGYNGSPSGAPHCIENPCPGARDESGNNTKCISLHAEQNAILQSGANLAFATRIYVTSSPCFGCAKLILGTRIKTIITKEVYSDASGIQILKDAGLQVFLFNDGGVTLL